jgi:two-component system chemotaxis response regulator CheB
MKKKVIVVDDSPSIRSLFTSILNADPELEVVDTAEDAQDAREKIKLHKPDVITLDVEMPGMDGIAFLEKIMTLRPMPVVMCSTLTQRGADTTIQALEIGAIDYVGKPSQDANDLVSIGTELVEKVKVAASARISSGRRRSATNILNFSGDPAHYLIAIGASTGGVEALRDILTPLPANSPAVVITQHMPLLFTQSFANRLDKICVMHVQQAKNNQRIEPGNVYIAPGNLHMRIKMIGEKFVCKLYDEPPVSSHKPSVDVMFESIANGVPADRMVGIILTGMGRDGATGLKQMRDAGAYTIGQNEATCVVYGMPKAAFNEGGVQKQLSLNDIPKHLMQYCSKHS